MTNWTNGEHAMALKAERERMQREMSIELADWQASSEAYRLDAERLRAKIERLKAVLESLTKDPPASLAREPDEDWEVIVKMRAIAKAALEPKP
jgi:hypothetical protein